MKKYFFFALLAASTQVGHAQSIAAGTISLGGSIGYNSSTYKKEYKSGGNTSSNEETRSQFQFSPSVGYFLADNLAIGLGLGYTSTKYKVTYSGPGRTSPNPLDASTTLRVGPYVQYYKMLSEQFGVLGTLGAGYQSGFAPNYSDNNPGRIIETKTSGYYAALTPGVIFFPIPKFGLSASIGNLGYEQANVKQSDDVDGESEKYSSFGASFGLSQLQFGGTYYFGR